MYNPTSRARIKKLQSDFEKNVGYSVLVASPVSARLYVLLGLPLAFGVDACRGRARLAAVPGVALVALGVGGFQLASSRASKALPVSGANDSDLSPEELLSVDRRSTDRP